MHAFLSEALRFLDIARVIEGTLEASEAIPVAQLRRPVRRGRGGTADGVGTRRAAGGARLSWFLAFAGFSALIILHELGHFVMAKRVGMRVERFSLFFPPYLARKRRGETEYCIGLVPLGGFVKITGMNPEEELPPEVAPRALLPPAGVEADRRDRRGPRGQHPDRVRDPVLPRVRLRRGRSRGWPTSRPARPPPRRCGPATGSSPSTDVRSEDPTVIAQQISSHKCAGQPRSGCRAADAGRAAHRARRADR